MSICAEFRVNLYERAYAKWGRDKQTDKAIEEMSELTKALLKFRNHNGSLEAVADEVADVEIMMEQIRFIYDHEAPVGVDFNKMVNEIRRKKLFALDERLKQ